MELIENIRKHYKRSTYPSNGSLGSTFFLAKDFSKKLEGIKYLTSKDGRERAINVYYAFGQLVISDYTLGSHAQVITRDKISAQLKPQKTKYELLIHVNDKIVLRSTLKPDEIEKIEKYIIYISSFHTHPLHNEQDLKTWGFFSDTDLSSFVEARNLYTSGLITKNYWMLIKTSDFKTMNIDNYTATYHDLLNEKEPNFYPLIRILNKSGIGVFKSSNARRFERVI